MRPGSPGRAPGEPGRPGRARIPGWRCWIRRSGRRPRGRRGFRRGAPCAGRPGLSCVCSLLRRMRGAGWTPARTARSGLAPARQRRAIQRWVRISQPPRTGSAVGGPRGVAIAGDGAGAGSVPATGTAAGVPVGAGRPAGASAFSTQCAGCGAHGCAAASSSEWAAVCAGEGAVEAGWWWLAAAAPTHSVSSPASNTRIARSGNAKRRNGSVSPILVSTLATRSGRY